jgi:hypothetical protein
MNLETAKYYGYEAQSNQLVEECAELIQAVNKGCKGAHLILSDWKYVGARYSDGDYVDPYDKESWELTGAKMVVVDGEKIKEDTYYRCIEGEIVEVTEDGEIVEE